MSNRDVDDRYRYMGLEMIPTPRYDVITRSSSTAGTGWLYRFADKFVAIKFNDDKVLSGTNMEPFYPYQDWDRGDAIQDVILESASDGLSIPEALDRVREKFGEPDAVVELADVNNPVEVFCAKAEEMLNS